MSHVHPANEPAPKVDWVKGAKDSIPAWYGGAYLWNKQWGSGAKHSGPSGRRAGRYYPPVNNGQKTYG